MRRLVLVLLLFSSLSVRAEDLRSFVSEPFSFKIGAPLTWTLLPADFPTVAYKVHHENINDLVADREKLPLVRIVKAVPENRTISPAVQVFVEFAKGSTPTGFLTSASRSVATGFADFKITHEASDKKLNGIQAAYIECTFTAEYSHDRRFPTLSRLWAIPRDKLMFVIAITGQPDDLKPLANEIDLILSTIKFTNE